MELTDEMVTAKWAEVAPLIDTMMDRIQTPGDFPVQSGSELADDDAVSTPYQVSHAARWCLNSGVEHLHALKKLVIDDGVIHSAASNTLVRGALENIAAGFWILQPAERSVRVEHGLRWWMKNFRDQDKATRTAGLPDTNPVRPRLEALIGIGLAANCDRTQLESRYYSTAVLEYADEHSTSAHQPHLIWQICSGFAHGRPWATIDMNEMETQLTAEEGVSLVRFTSDHKRLLGVTLPAFRLMTDLVRLFQERGTTTSSAPTR